MKQNILLTTFFIWIFVAKSQDTTFINSNLILEEITIHSTIDIEDNKTQIIRLNQKEITKSLSKNTADLLEKSTSISIQKSQNGGGSPNIRGFEANRILLVVDGVKLNNTIYRSGHLQNILSVDQNSLESLSVLHGPSSVFYGSGALGGAIILNTINPQNHDPKTLFSSQFESSSNTFISNIQNISKSDKSSSFTSLSFKKFGDLKMGENRFHGYEDWGKEEFVTIENTQLFSKYSQIDAMQKTHYQINSASDIILNNQYSTTSNINRFDKLNDVSDSLPKYKYWYYGPQNRFLSSVNYKRKTNSKYFDDFDVLLAYQNNTESRHKQKYNDDFITNRIENITVYDAKISFEKQNMDWNFNYGISSRYQDLKSDAYNYNDGDSSSSFATTRYPDNGSNVFNVSPFILSEYSVNTNLKWFNAIRFNHENLVANFSENYLLEIDNQISMLNSNFSASSSVSYWLNSHNFISLSLYNAFRNPNIDDIGKVFSKNDGVVVVPNTNLKSEKNNSVELIYRLESKKSNIEIAVFTNCLKDAITKREISINGEDSILYDGEMLKMIANTNVNSANMYGVNFHFGHSFSDNIKFSLRSSFVDGTSSDSLPLAHIPPFSLRSELNYTTSKTSNFSFYTKYNSWKKLEDFDINGVDNLEEATSDGTPSWYTLNLCYSYLFSKSKFSISCVNILDSHYKTFASAISSSGRNFIISLQTQF